MLVLSLVSAGFVIRIGILLVAQGLLYGVGFTVGWIVNYPHAQRDARCEKRVGFENHAGILTNLGNGYGNNPAPDALAVASGEIKLRSTGDAQD